MRFLEFSSAVADLVLVSPVLGTKRDLELNEQKNEKKNWRKATWQKKNKEWDKLWQKTGGEKEEQEDVGNLDRSCPKKTQAAMKGWGLAREGGGLKKPLPSSTGPR